LTNPVAHSDGFDSNSDGARDQQTFNDCGLTCGLPFGSCSTETHYEEGWWVTKTNSITYDAPIIEYIRTTSAGLEVKMSVSNLLMPLNVFSNYKVTQCTSYEMDIAGDIRTDKIEIVGVMPIAMNGNELSTEFEELTIDISDINLDVNWSSWSWWDYILDNTVGEIGNLIVDYFNESIEETLEAEMRNSVEPLIGDFFQSISYGTEISLSSPLSGTLAIDAQLTYATVVDGYGRFGMQTQTRPSSKGTTIPEEAKGVLRSGHVTDWFSSDAYGFGLAFKTDFMNQIMWATWYGGGLDIANVESSMDLGDGIAINFSTGLPPILMPSEDPDWDGTLGFGDIYVESEFDLGEGVNVAVSLYLSGMVNFDFDFDAQQNQLSLVPSETANIWIEVVDISSPDLQADLSASLQEIFSSIFPELLTPILSSIPLPEFDVGGLAGLPQSEIWTLTNGAVEKTEGQIRFTGSLQ